MLTGITVWQPLGSVARNGVILLTTDYWLLFFHFQLQPLHLADDDVIANPNP